MEYEVVQLGPMLVMGVELRTTNENWEVAKVIGPFWGHFWRENLPSKIPHKKTNDVLGFYCEYEKDHTKPYTIVAGCEVTMADQVPKGFVVKKAPASKYALFTIKGKYPDALMQAWQWIWNSPLRRTYTGDFELYPAGWDFLNNTEMQLFIAIS